MVVSVLVIVAFSPGPVTTLVMVEPGKVRVAYSVIVALPPDAVKVVPGRVVVSSSVTVKCPPGAVVTSVEPGRKLVIVEVNTKELFDPGAVIKLVYVAPGNVFVTVAGPLTGPIGVEHEDTTTV